jgi:hypothetical protein
MPQTALKKTLQLKKRNDDYGNEKNGALLKFFFVVSLFYMAV